MRHLWDIWDMRHQKPDIAYLHIKESKRARKGLKGLKRVIKGPMGPRTRMGHLWDI